MIAKYNCDSNIVNVKVYEPQKMDEYFYICAFSLASDDKNETLPVYRAGGNDPDHALGEALKTMRLILEGQYDSVTLIEPSAAG